MARRQSAAGLIVAWGLVYGAACGGDTDTGGGGDGGSGLSTSAGGQGAGASEDLPEQYCSGQIARDEQCGDQPETLQQCLASSNTACFFDVVRPAIVRDLITCLIERPCGESDDNCFYSVGAAAPTAGQEDYLSACTAKYDTCSGEFSMDYCGATIFTTAMYQQISACLELDCAEVRNCIRGSYPVSCN